MKIAIIEKGHFEVAFTLIALFKAGSNDITLFIDHQSAVHLRDLLGDDADRIHWVIQGNGEANRSFISRIFIKLQQHDFDLVYFSTIADNHLIYSNRIRRYLAKTRTVLNIHNINEYFVKPPNFSIRASIKAFGKKRLIKSIDEVTVFSPEMARYLKKFPVAKNKMIHEVAGRFFLPTGAPQTEKSLDVIRICVPGSVDERRRNYQDVFELLDLAWTANTKLELIFSGAFEKGWSEDIYTKAKQYEAKKQLKLYETNYVSQSDFDDDISSAHFVWLPLQKHMRNPDMITEEYGISIVSGVIGDVIRHAKPFLAPGFLTVEAPLNMAAIRYNSMADLLKMIQDLSSSNYSALVSRTRTIALYYTLEAIRERNPALFSS